jgi:flagellar basal-body rod modification protein FlgD
MNVNPVSSGAIFPMANAKAPANSQGTSSNPTQDLKNMFLQLLTTQLKNQSPINPVDSSQFTSQLVQFNMLDQLAEINQTLQNAFAVSPPAAADRSSSNHPLQGAQ